MNNRAATDWVKLVGAQWGEWVYEKEGGILLENILYAATVFVILLAFILLLMFLKDKERSLKKVIVIERNSVWENDFSTYTDLEVDKIETIKGVISVTRIGGSKIYIETDPRVGRSVVIDKLLDMVQIQQKEGERK